MQNVLVTGATGFLGYQVVKLLTERGYRPRALVGADEHPRTSEALGRLGVELVSRDLNDAGTLRAACQGMDTVLHAKFELSLGGGEKVKHALKEVNVLGTERLVHAATVAGVQRVVLSSSALSVGLNREPQPLDESADWEAHSLSLPYALSRRHAEQAVLTRPNTEGRPTIVAVNPTLTLGPDDFDRLVPANHLISWMAHGLRLDVPNGFSILDVRDYADGMLRAAERGRHGERYLLSGENVTTRQLLEAVCEVSGAPAPRWLLPLRPAWLAPPIALYEFGCQLTGTSPKFVRSALDIWSRYAWYDTHRAQSELGWRARSLRESLQDTLAWWKGTPRLDQPVRKAASSVEGLRS